VTIAPRWRKVARDLLAHKLRTLLVVLSIAVGIFAILVVMGGRGILLDSFGTNFPKSDPASAVLYTSPFGSELVDRVGRSPGVAIAEGRQAAVVRYRSGDLLDVSEPPAQMTQASPPRDISLVAATDWAAVQVDRVFAQGGAPWPPGRDEVVLETSSQQISPLAAGDVVTVDLPDGTRKLLRVAGFAHDINAVPAMFSGRLVGYVTPQSMADLQQGAGMNELVLSLSDAHLDRAGVSRAVSKIRDDVVAPVGIVTYSAYVPTPGSHQLGDIFKAVSILLLALGAMALGLSGFLVVNTVSALLAQQMKQLGIMKAVGGRVSQITAMLLTLVAVYGGLAILIGLPLGSYWASWFARFAGGLLDFGPAAATPPLYTIVLAVAVGFLVPLIAAAFPIHTGTRVSVVNALNATGMDSQRFGHSLIDRALGRLRGLPRPTALSLRNTFRKKGRLALTLATLVLATSVVMSVGSVRGSILKTVSDVSQWWNYDVEVNFAQPESATLVQREALKVRGVTGAEGWLVTAAALKRGDGSENDQLSVVGLPPRTRFVTPAIVTGRWLRDTDSNAVVVNTDLVKSENLSVGQTVKLHVHGADRQFRIVGVVRGQLMGPVFFANQSYLSALIGSQGSVTRVLVRTDDHTIAGQDGTADQLQRHFTDMGVAVAGVQGEASNAADLANQLGILVTFLIVMAVILSAVGVIGLTGTMIINVLESTREIGVMRAIGASHASIFKVFVTEGFTIGLLAWLGGAALSWPMSYALVRLLESAVGIPLSFEFSWQVVVACLFVVSAISAAASLLPAYNASQVSVRDAIAYE